MRQHYDEIRDTDVGFKVYPMLSSSRFILAVP